MPREGTSEPDARSVESLDSIVDTGVKALVSVEGATKGECSGSFGVKGVSTKACARVLRIAWSAS